MEKKKNEKDKVVKKKKSNLKKEIIKEEYVDIDLDENDEEIERERYGFTLIELLAVVVIIGLFVFIAYPAVNKYLNETRKTTYSLYESDMKSAASNLVADCLKNNKSECAPINGNSKKVYLSELINQNYSNALKDPAKDGALCDDKSSYVVIKSKLGNVADYDYDVCLVCSNYKSGICGTTNSCDNGSDKTKPTCGNVVGESSIWTNKDRVISVGCNDSGCGCSTSPVYKKFTTDTTTGNITISDEAGNTTNCPVNVYVDKTAPTCTLEVIGTKEGNWYNGNSVTVKLKTMNDNLSDIATYGMGESYNNPDFNKSREYSVNGGITTVFGYVKDNAGNVGMCSVEVKHDNTKPVIKTFNYGYIVYPKSDMNSKTPTRININSLISEYSSIHGGRLVLTSNNSGMTVNLGSGSSVIDTKTISAGTLYTEFKIEDKKYNDLWLEFANQTQRDQLKTFEVYTYSSSGFYTNQNVNVYINAIDSYSGKASYSFDGVNYQNDSFKSFSKNTSNIKLYMKDVSGNISDVKLANITNIDKLIPSCTLKKNATPAISGSEWFKNDVSAVFNTVYDSAATTTNANSGVRNYSFTSTGFGSNTSSLQSSATSGTTHTGYVVDKAGNVGSCSTVIKLDKTNPTAGTVTMKKTNSRGASISTGGKVNTDVYVSLNNGSDTGTAQSGHYTTKYTVVRDSTTVHSNITSAQTYSTAGDYKITVTTTDYSGRTKTNTYTFRIDKTKPTCGAKTGEGSSTSWTNTNRTISVKCSDSSGCTKNDYSQEFSSNATTSFIRIYDNAGNFEDCPVNVYIDKTKPVCGAKTGEGSTTNWSKTNREISVACSDALSQCKKTSYKATYSSNTKTATIRIYDNANNYEDCSVNVYVDKCTSYNENCSTGTYGACSATCGAGTQSATKTCSKTSNFGSGFACGTSTSTVSKACTGTTCDIVGCPSDSELFGSAAPISKKGVDMTGYSNYGAYHTLSYSYTCSGGCSVSWGYDRICISDKCAKWKGYTADYMKRNGAFGSCNADNYARWWCQCSAN